MAKTLEDYLQEQGPDNTASSTLESVGESAGQHGALALNSALFGLGPKAAYLAGALLPGEKGQGEKYEQETDKYLARAREDNPISGVIAELVGGLAVPLPGAGLGKTALGGIKALQGTGKAATLARVAGEGAIGGLASGALRGATGAYGEGGTTGLAEGVGKGWEGAKEGGVTGAAVGGALGTVAGVLANKARGARLAATGAGAGEQNELARMTNTRDPFTYLQGVKNKEFSRAEELGILGHHPLQSAENVAERSTRIAKEQGAKLEGIVDQLNKSPKASVPTSQISDIAFAPADAIHASNTKLAGAKDGATQYLDWLGAVFDDTRGAKFSIKDMHEVAKNINTELQGLQHSKMPSDTVKSFLIKTFRDDLQEMMNRTAQKVDPKLAQELATTSADTHAALTIRGLSQDPAMRWDAVRQSLLGKGITAMGGTAAFTALGLNPVLSRILSGATSAPGVMPNTLLWADRLRRGLPSSAKIGGVLATGPSTKTSP